MSVISLLHAVVFAAALLSGGEEPAVRVLRTGGLKMESVALLVSGEQGGSIHVAVLPLLFPGTAGRVRVPVVLEIDGATLLKGNTGGLLRVEICLYAVTQKAVQGSLLETVEVDLARAGAEVERGGLQYTGELSLAPGDTSLRVLVRNAATGEVGLRLLSLTVPDFTAAPLLLSPVFSNPAEGWVPALSKAAQTSPAALADGRLPAAQAVLGIDQETRVEIPVWKLKPEELKADGLKIEILRPDGGRAAELPARIEARREAAGIDWLTISFVPAGLETGRYQIRALISGPPASPAWSSPFVLLPGGGEGKVWAELMHGVQAPAREAREPASSRRRRLDAGPIRDAYREALRLLAAGDEPAARRAVAALETPLLTGQVPASPTDVTEIERDVARDLSATRPQCLLPITLLHESLYSDAMKRHDLLVATHHRELVFALADLYAERGPAADARRTAARLLLGFASRLPDSVSLLLRERLFEQVLAYDPNEPATVLYLAAEAERGGRYPQAVTHLERLLLIRPNDPEARLRLAVNLRRLGKPAEADRLLDGLIRTPKEPEAPVTPDAWVLTLAYQETARALITAGRLDDAQSFLRDALQRLPGDEKLLFQRASLYDMRSDPDRARKILADFRAVREGPESARHRLQSPPHRRAEPSLERAGAHRARASPRSRRGAQAGHRAERLMKRLLPALLLLLLQMATPQRAAALPVVTIAQPAACTALFGAVDILVEARPDDGSPIQKVELYFDRLRVGVDEKPPYRFTVDAGQENREHQIEAVAWDAAGGSTTARLTAPPLQVDMQIDVRLQQLFVSLDHSGKAHSRLAPADFTILVDGAPQTIANFGQEEVPFTAVLLLDASTSIEKKDLDTAVDGIRSFVRAMSRLDEAKLLVFSDRILVETPFTNFPSILTLGLSDVEAGGGTALHDALYLALKRLDDRPGRKVIALLSDGVDIESVVPMQTVRDVARRSQTLLYWLRLGSPGDEKAPLQTYSTAWRDAEGNRRGFDELRATVFESGGHIETLHSIDEMPAVLARILKELREQYVLGFSPTVQRGPGTWHKVELQVRNAGGAKVRVQEGYVEK